MTTAALSDRQLLIPHQLSPEVEAACNDRDQHHRAMRDAMDVLGGKWKIPIVGVLTFKGKMRFTELLRNVEGIGAKMLSKELQDLEANKLVTRTVKQTKPITVEYEMTEYGLTLSNLICEIMRWGLEHRKRIMQSETVSEPTL